MAHHYVVLRSSWCLLPQINKVAIFTTKKGSEFLTNRNLKHEKCPTNFDKSNFEKCPTNESNNRWLILRWRSARATVRIDKILKMFGSRLSNTGNVVQSQQVRGSRGALHSWPYLSGSNKKVHLQSVEARRVSLVSFAVVSPLLFFYKYGRIPAWLFPVFKKKIPSLKFTY